MAYKLISNDKNARAGTLTLNNIEVHLMYIKECEDDYVLHWKMGLNDILESVIA